VSENLYREPVEGKLLPIAGDKPFNRSLSYTTLRTFRDEDLTLLRLRLSSYDLHKRNSLELIYLEFYTYYLYWNDMSAIIFLLFLVKNDNNLENLND
jgi:hypothetical protein